VAGRVQREQPCSLALDNVLIRRVAPGGEIRVTANSVLTARRTTFQNLNFQATGGEVTLENCLIFGTPPPDLLLWKDVQWRGKNNLYDLRSLRFDQASFTAQTFPEFQKLTSHDAGSQWRELSAESPAPAGIGAAIAAQEASAVPSSEHPLLRQP
jgi:hypothetical protein